MVEYFVFCIDDRPLHVSELATLVSRAGWTLRVVRNWLAADAFRLITDGTLDNNDVTMGWPNDSGLAAEFDAALARSDRKQLNNWLSNYQIGSALWASRAPFDLSEHTTFESIDDARDQMGNQYADHLAQTKRMYFVTNCPHMEFAAIVMGAAAILRDGLIEDSQMGACIPAPHSDSELSRFLESWPAG